MNYVGELVLLHWCQLLQFNVQEASVCILSSLLPHKVFPLSLQSREPLWTCKTCRERVASLHWKERWNSCENGKHMSTVKHLQASGSNTVDTNSFNWSNFVLMLSIKGLTNMKFANIYCPKLHLEANKLMLRAWKMFHCVLILFCFSFLKIIFPFWWDIHTM